MKLNKLLSISLIIVVCSVFMVFMMQTVPTAAQTVVECPCKGGITSFSLKNLTGQAGTFYMGKPGQETYFLGEVDVGGVFTGTNGGLTFHGGDTTIEFTPTLAIEPLFTFIIHTSCSQPLNVGFVFPLPPATGLVEVVALESMDGGVCPAVCLPNSISGSPTLSYAANTATWEITHTGTDYIILESMKLNWPSGNGNLVKVSFDGNVIWTGNASDPFSNSTWIADTQLARTMAGGATVGVEVEFANTAAAPSSGDGYYFNLVFFGDDCDVNAAKVVSFGEAPAPHKPIPTALILGSLVSMMAVGYLALIRKPRKI